MLIVAALARFHSPAASVGGRQDQTTLGLAKQKGFWVRITRVSTVVIFQIVPAGWSSVRAVKGVGGGVESESLTPAADFSVFSPSRSLFSG